MGGPADEVNNSNASPAASGDAAAPADLENRSPGEPKEAVSVTEVPEVDEVIAVAESDPIVNSAPPSMAAALTTSVDAAEPMAQSDEPMAIAEAAPTIEPSVLADADADAAPTAMATTETGSVTTPMVVTEPVEDTEHAGELAGNVAAEQQLDGLAIGEATSADSHQTPTSSSAEPMVVVPSEPDSESTVVSAAAPNDGVDSLTVAEAEHATEPMVVTTPAATPEISQPPTAADDPAPSSKNQPNSALPPKIGAVHPSPGDVVAGVAPPQPAVSSRAPGDPGKVVEGAVTGVSADGVELTLDDGRAAFISRRNFGLNNEAPDTVLSIGDRALGVELSREDPKSRVVLSRSWALKKQAWDKIVAASQEGTLLTGRVVSGSKKGVVVDVGVRGFVPMSHLELEPVADVSSYVDQSFELKVLEVDAQKEKLVLSRRSALLKAQRKQLQEIISGIKPGEVRTGKVSSFADYGAFIDLGGVNGLAHISELSWDRVGKPSDVLSLGQEVQVKVLDVKAKKKRISLSLRQTTDDPLARFEVGSLLNGPVTRLVDFRAFVLVDGFEGLVHLSELAEYRVSAPEEIVAPGDVVGVKVLSIDTKRRRLELSIRRAAEYQG